MEEIFQGKLHPKASKLLNMIFMQETQTAIAVLWKLKNLFVVSCK